jgi:hypothetical protein
MFVALVGGELTSSGRWLLCCAVKKGMDDTNEEPISDIGSIWRESIEGKYRGYGIATKLMNAGCEGCSRAHGWMYNDGTNMDHQSGCGKLLHQPNGIQENGRIVFC